MMKVMVECIRKFFLCINITELWFTKSGVTLNAFQAKSGFLVMQSARHRCHTGACQVYRKEAKVIFRLFLFLSVSTCAQ